MKRDLLMLAAALAAGSAAHAAIVATADRTDARYKVGEVADFVVTVTPDKETAPTGVVSVVVYDSGDKLAKKETFAYSGKATFKVPAKMDRPGFWRCGADVKVGAKPGKVRSAWGIACEPEKIRAAAPRPADFDDYWDGEVARLAREVPLDAKMTPRKQPKGSDKFDYYDVSFATFGGKRVYGILSIPKDRSKAPFQVRVRVPGAGAGWTSTGGEIEGTVALLMNVHPFPTQLTKEDQKRLYDEENAAFTAKYGVKTYAKAGISVSREEYFFHDVILGINRSVDWVAQQPFANPKDIVYCHGSQGGAFGYFLLGLNRNFRRGVMYVTAMCDHLAADDGRKPGWPDLIDSQTTEEGRANARRFAPYFDAVNFAPRIKVPVLSVAGFIDQTCHPATVWAAYNALGTKDKMMIDGLGMRHPLHKHLHKSISDWVCEKDGKAAREIRAILVHLGYNMWCDWFPEGTDMDRVPERVGRPSTKLRCKDEFWKSVVDHAIERKMNMIVIDVGEGVVYPSHPELAIEGSWSVGKLKGEIARLKAAGIECIPKLNFSTTHNGWLKQYRRLVGTPEYYRVVEDVLKDVCGIFNHPRFCHLGYDEERESYSPRFEFVVIRKGQAWERDFLETVKVCERLGMRPWVWSDYTWKHKDFLKRCPKSVIFSDWYYDEHNLGFTLERSDSHDYERLENFFVLRDAGFDQIPCGTNWQGVRRRNGVGAEDVIGRLVHFARTEIPGEHLLGFMMAPWNALDTEERRDFANHGTDLFADALDGRIAR